MEEIVRIIFSPKVLVILMVFSIPLAAIVGSFYLKAQKLKLQAGGIKQEDVLLLKKTISENQDLKKRVENLEAIVTAIDKDVIDFKMLEKK